MLRNTVGGSGTPDTWVWSGIAHGSSGTRVEQQGMD
jgi:hypothetical protein